MTSNRLTHWDQSEGTYFITFRLADAVPLSLQRVWRQEQEIWLSHHPRPWDESTEMEYHRRFSTQMDRWLDTGYGSCQLRSDQCRRTLSQVLTAFEPDKYLHHAWVVMPNHVHTLTTLRAGTSLRHLVKAWKGTSARQINQLSGSHGSIWQEDYFDRLIRDGNHFATCVRYIRNNPSHARLNEAEYSLQESSLAALFAGRR